jgi:ornithine decarboxylase
MKAPSAVLQEMIIDYTRQLTTPFLVIDLDQARDNIRRIRQALPDATLFYAVKCNADPRILEAVEREGVGFEVASVSEAEVVLRLGVVPERIICHHPIKSPDFLRFMHRHRIDVLAVDNVHELDKIAEYAPGSRVMVRIGVSNQSSVVPLNRKFGVEPQGAVKLLDCARTLNLVPFGITIHVGSQCERLETWIDALEACQDVYRQARDAGIRLSLVSLGGGLPAPYAKNSLSLESIGKVVKNAISRMNLHEDCALSVEPGRAVAASAGVLITTVVGLAERADGSWAYIDAGVYHGLFEASRAGGRIPYPVTVRHSDRRERFYNIGGPTCDSFDLPFEKILLPELRIGDRIAIHSAGAYSTAISSTFNGFSGPAVHYLDDLAQQP